MDKIKMKLNKKHDYLYEVAEDFGYSIKEFISYGLIANLRIAINIIGDGLYYVCKSDLEKFISETQEIEYIKLTEIYPVATHKTVYPPEHDANIGNVFYAYEEDFFVNCKELIILRDDLMQLFDHKSACLEGDNLTNQNLKRRQQAAIPTINSKRERTLLTLIAVLREIIVGDFSNKNVKKHPSISGITDLISKLDEMETYGLGKRNLEDIFEEAKQAKEISIVRK